MPAGCLELKNSFGDTGYGGPQPPRGSGEHPYIITLYALSAERLNLPANASLGVFLKAIEGRVLGTAKVTGIYER